MQISTWYLVFSRKIAVVTILNCTSLSGKSKPAKPNTKYQVLKIEQPHEAQLMAIQAVP
jgi:hypothetical protein